MKTQLNKTDELNASLHLTIEPEDFLPEYEKQIKQINKTTKMPGFRPGHIPKSMIEKKFGDQVLVESVLNIANDKVNSYVKEEKLDILGYPLSSENQAQIDVFTKDKSYEFIFDLGFTPKIELNLEGLQTFEKMVLKPSDTMINEEIEHVCRQFGNQESTDMAVEGDSVLILLNELNENNEVIEGGVSSKSTRILINTIKDEPTKQLFLTTKKGDECKVAIKNLFNDDHNEMMHALNISHDAVHDLSANFSAKIEEITHIQPAENNQELWDKAFGEGTCKSEEDFRNEIGKMLTNMYEANTQHILEHDVTDTLINNTNITLPDEFMKRWLIQAHPKEYTTENVESKYGVERKGLQWQLIREKIEERFAVEINNDDLELAAFMKIRDLFAQVGMPNAPYEQIKGFAMDRMKDEKFVKEIAPMAMQQKVMSALISNLQVNQVEYNHEELIEKIKAHNAKHHAHHHAHEHEHEHEHNH